MSAATQGVTPGVQGVTPSVAGVLKRLPRGELRLIEPHEFPVDAPDELARHRFVRLAYARHGLAERQAEILYHLCRGVTTNEGIGAATGISPQTVKNHLTAGFKRLRVVDRTQALVRVWTLYLRATNRPD